MAPQVMSAGDIPEPLGSCGERRAADALPPPDGRRTGGPPRVRGDIVGRGGFAPRIAPGRSTSPVGTWGGAGGGTGRSRGEATLQPRPGADRVLACARRAPPFTVRSRSPWCFGRTRDGARDERNGRRDPHACGRVEAGGPPAIARLIDAFYDRVERDDLLSPFFPGGVTRSTAGTSPCGGPRCSAARATTPTPGRLRPTLAPPRPVDHARSTAAVRDHHEPGRRRRRAARGPGVPRRAGQLPGVGNEAGHGQLAARREAARARTGAPVGLGCGPGPTWAAARSRHQNFG